MTKSYRASRLWHLFASPQAPSSPPAMTFPLLQLANELVAAIIGQIDDIHTLRSLARTCHCLQYLAEAILYRSIFHRTGTQAALLSHAVASRPERAEVIHVIDSRCEYSRRGGLLSLVSVIATAKNLRELTIESPFCNHAYGNTTDIWNWQRLMSQLLAPVLPSKSNQTLSLSGNTLPRLRARK